MSDRYFVKLGDYQPAGRATWYVKQRVPAGHEPYIMATCNQQDDAELICTLLNDYDARLLADLMAAKTTGAGDLRQGPKSNPESTSD